MIAVGPAGESVGSDTFARQLQMAEGLARVRRECTDLRTERNALAESVSSLLFTLSLSLSLCLSLCVLPPPLGLCLFSLSLSLRNNTTEQTGTKSG